MAKQKDNYFAERNYIITDKLRYIIQRLPSFCRDYFVGIEMQTSPLTRLNYATDLRIFFEFLLNYLPYFENKRMADLSLPDLEKLTALDISYFLSFLTEYKIDGKLYSNSEKGKARKLSSVKALFKFFYNHDKLSKNVSAKVSHPKIHEKEIIRLDKDEIIDILTVINQFNGLHSERQNKYNQNTRDRDLAIITLLLGTGIRVSECVGLSTSDIDFADNAFVVTRKGGNRTTLFFSNEIKEALQSYLAVRKDNANTDALFLSLQNKRITVRAVEYLVEKYAKVITPLKHITPHKLRSTYGTNLYRETKDIYVVAEVLGHKDINTTKKHYAALGEDIKREAASKVTLIPKD